MKKKILAICLISALALTACGGNNSTVSTDNNMTTEYSSEVEEFTSEVTDKSTSMEESSESMEEEIVVESTEAEEITESSEVADESTEETVEKTTESKETVEFTKESEATKPNKEAEKTSEATKPSSNTKPTESTKPSASTPSTENPKPSTKPTTPSVSTPSTEPSVPSVEPSTPSVESSVEPSAPSVVACNHTYTVEEVASTCTVAGYKKEYCTKCNEVKSNETLALADHNVQTNILTPGTCSNGEESEGRCTVCNTRVWYIPSQMGRYGEHKYSVKKKTLEPTCNLSGTYSYLCEYCGIRGIGMSEDIPATGLHVPTGNYTVATAPTCTTNGTERDHCTNCGVALDETIRTLPAFGHVDVDGDHFCDRCGDIW